MSTASLADVDPPSDISPDFFKVWYLDHVDRHNQWHQLLSEAGGITPELAAMHKGLEKEADRLRARIEAVRGPGIDFGCLHASALMQPSTRLH